MTYRNGGEGGILTPAYSLSYHVFSNMPENLAATLEPAHQIPRNSRSESLLLSVQSVCYDYLGHRGEVSERLKELASKASVGGTLPWVRIPPSPPFL